MDVGPGPLAHSSPTPVCACALWQWVLELISWLLFALLMTGHDAVARAWTVLKMCVQRGSFDPPCCHARFALLYHRWCCCNKPTAPFVGNVPLVMVHARWLLMMPDQVS